jgi:hypothetical protein
MIQPLSIMSPTAGLSFDSSDSSVIGRDTNDLHLWKAQVVPSELMDHVDRVASNIKKIKSAWSKPFRDIEAGYKLVVADLRTMNDNFKTMYSHLGDPSTSEQGQTVWEVLEYLQGAYGDLETATADLEDKMSSSIDDRLLHMGIPTDFPSLVDGMRQT